AHGGAVPIGAVFAAEGSMAIADHPLLSSARMETGMAEATLTPGVEQVVRDALAQSPIQSHRKIRVEQAGETLYLHGCVESYYYKQLAQEVVRNVCRGV